MKELFNNSKYYVIIVLTFVIVFLMNYIGSDAPDKLSRALMNGGAGAVGIAIGLIIYQRGKNGDNKHHDID
ncbi:hypothetical protein KRE40_17155 [Elizabethkingia meningoseptica]|uniref:Uncharacterized protein n=1 Tax=Elizabethkingia meningoseptica TaxID=238 RepID=A0A1V3TZA9_ELIME|nr:MULTISPECIES: hypothetical protein [Elizabethkingia]AQX06667.1 hypothetical protein BBD33_16015 [Elizabethkingia meningoseptica]AQX10925.1 hypothetical protein BBD35_00390 [Elizabethkingia meningoseptica]AQX48715.1 hypothetical protein B5G46_16010 [Elizabethkingia meningoseptica]EJK5330096.1 hypothetical protein [Elizabethkingia meningoseptica]EOR28783.1 hypothetical protein L100_14630 [Elizabethkingia meningoseptica ATCC 13253 = NBRC 12535]